MEKFWTWWQHIPENINPVILTAGSFQVRYYGLMYIIAFVTVYILVMYRIKKEKLEFTNDLILDFLFYGILAVLIGGRLGYVAFYEPAYFFKHPLKIIAPFEMINGRLSYTGISGMSLYRRRASSR